jgi:hypothetical protein
MIDNVLSPATGYYCTKLGEQVFFLNKFLFYSSLRLAKTLSGFRDLGKTRTKIFFVFLFHPLKYVVKKIRAPTHRKSLALGAATERLLSPYLVFEWRTMR